MKFNTIISITDNLIITYIENVYSQIKKNICNIIIKYTFVFII